MGWMHDTLEYIERDPIHRKWHHGALTFPMVYAYSEKYVLPISHDEVVHGKGALWNKMPGDRWRKFANLRAYLAFMWTHPGKKLLFMGSEIGQWNEWDHEQSLGWHLLDEPLHQGLHRWVRDLNTVYRGEPALHQRDFSTDGFAWVVVHDWEESVIAFLRRGHAEDDTILVLCNFTPVPRHNYRVGVPQGGLWRELLNSDAVLYGGSGQGNLGWVESAPVRSHAYFHSLTLIVPPLATLVLKHEGGS
jgi:1,4-alpha-glucan branching enzyme